jgi:hypothetical protein
VQVLLEVWHVALLVSSSISSAVLFTVKSMVGVAVAANTGIKTGAGRREACAMFGMSMAMNRIETMIEKRAFMSFGFFISARQAVD